VCDRLFQLPKGFYGIDSIFLLLLASARTEFLEGIPAFALDALNASTRADWNTVFSFAKY
jgi:hypothetical protein